MNLHPIVFVLDKPIKKQVISWQQYDEDIHQLAKLIKDSGQRYDVVAGYPRGGLIIAVHLSHLLKVPYARATVDSFLAGKTLVCDDISDTGKTLHRITRGTRKNTATLYRKNKTCFEPQFVVRTVKRWIVFPWEQ